MPTFHQYLARPLARRESAGGDDQVDPQAETGSMLPATSSPPDQLDHSHLRRRCRSPCPLLQSLPRKQSEESIRTELCEGPVLDSPSPSPLLPLAQTPEHDNSSSSAACLDRAALIERLKRGESPTWIPHRHVRRVPSACISRLYFFVMKPVGCLTNGPSFANSSSRYGANKSRLCLLLDARRVLLLPAPTPPPRQLCYRPRR